MAEITAPIVTITLVSGRRVRPRRLHAGDDRAAVQPAGCGRIVFSFVFSAFNSLMFSSRWPGCSSGPSTATRFVLFRWFNAGIRWIETSYDAVLEFTGGTGGRSSPSLVLLGITGWLISARPKAFIPTEDQGYLIVVLQAPDGTSREATARVLKRVDATCRGLEGVKNTVLIEGLNVINSANQSNCGVFFPVLEEWSRRAPGLRGEALAARLQGMLSAEVRDALVLVLQPSPIRGLSSTGGFELMIEDRGGKGVQALQRVVDQFQAEARKRPELAGVFTAFSARVPQLKFDIDRTKARRLDVPVSDVFAVLQANLGGYYINDFDLYGKVWKVMVQAEGACGRRRRTSRTCMCSTARATACRSARWARFAPPSARSMCRITTSMPPPRSTAGRC